MPQGNPTPGRSWFIIMIQDPRFKIQNVVQRLCPEKSENISSRDYVQKNMCGKKYKCRIAFYKFVKKCDRHWQTDRQTLLKDAPRIKNLRFFRGGESGSATLIIL